MALREKTTGIYECEVSGATRIRPEPLDDRAKKPSDGGRTPHGHRTPERDPERPPRGRGAAQASRDGPEPEEEPQGHGHDARRQDPGRQQRRQERRGRRPDRKGGRRRDRGLNGARPRDLLDAELVPGMGPEGVVGHQLIGHLER